MNCDDWRFVVVILVAGVWSMTPGCDRNSEKVRTKSTSPESASSESRSSEGGSSSGPSERAERPEGWEERVREKFERAPTPTGETRDAGPPCTFFPISCDRGESCFSAVDGTRRCRPVESGAEPGDRCTTADDCDRGQQCVGGPPGRCWTMCDPEHLDRWGCDDGETCTRVRSEGGDLFEWGVCRPRRNTCEPWPAEECGDGKACIRTNAGYRCIRPARDAAVGDPCSDPRDCRGPDVCVSTKDGERRCRPKCDETHPCDRGRCADLSDRPFGFCTPPQKPAEP